MNDYTAALAVMKKRLEDLEAIQEKVDLASNFKTQARFTPSEKMAGAALLAAEQSVLRFFPPLAEWGHLVSGVCDVNQVVVRRLDPKRMLTIIMLSGLQTDTWTISQRVGGGFLRRIESRGLPVFASAVMPAGDEASLAAFMADADARHEAWKRNMDDMRATLK